MTENNPDAFYRTLNPRGQRDNLEALCEFVGSQLENTVFVENFTTGMGSVMRSLHFSPRDAVLITNLTYFAVKVLARESGFSGLKGVQLTLDMPLSREKILQKYEEVLIKNPNIKIAIIDHITSPSSIMMPVKELAQLCHRYDVLVAVDGAHTCGQILLNIENLGVDFYSGNLHKWLYTPRGCGYLWVSSQYRSQIRPAVVSHFHGVSFHYDFCVRGTRDDTPYHCVTSAISYMQYLGGYSRIHEYITNLLDDALRHLEASWNTTRLDVDLDLEAPFMRLIRVPDTVKCPRTPVGGADLETYLYDHYHIRLLCMLVADHLYLRLSANVYNEPSDFRRLDEAMLDIMKLPIVPSKDRGYNLPIMHWDLASLVMEYPK